MDTLECCDNNHIIKTPLHCRGVFLIYNRYMDIQWLTKPFVAAINKYLTNWDDSELKGFIEGSDLTRGITLSDDYSWNQENYNARELRAISAIYLLLINEQDKNYMKYRELDNSIRKYHIYNKNANVFNVFMISNFNTQLNDESETRWLDIFSQFWTNNNISPIAENLRDNGNLLVKCTTTTEINSKYMVGNYDMNDIDYCSITSEYSQNRVTFQGDKVDDVYDSLFSRKIKPIRGFVRYDENGKFDFLYRTNTAPPQTKDFLIAIFSVFTKGGCMAKEGEYRFLIITPGNIESISFRLPHFHTVFNFNKTELNTIKNLHYKTTCDESDPCNHRFNL